jgi:hypothetical protein
MGNVKFTCNVLSIVKTALQQYIDRFNMNQTDGAIQRASNEVIYHLYTDTDVEILLKAWSESNKGETTLFKNGLDNDCRQMWNIIWKSEEYKKILNSQYCMGTNGSGVFDKALDKFIPCSKGDHYLAIIEALKCHANMWILYKAFRKDSEPIEELDNFILKNFILVGNKNSKTWYVPSKRQY